MFRLNDKRSLKHDRQPDVTKRCSDPTQVKATMAMSHTTTLGCSNYVLRLQNIRDKTTNLRYQTNILRHQRQ